MVDWLAGKRVRGTSSERSGFGLSLGGSGVGGWVELGRTTLGSAGDTISVTSLPNKRYYMLLKSCTAAVNTVYDQLRFNSDTGTNYTGRRNYNGGTDYLTTSTNFIEFGGYDVGIPWFDVSYVANYASKEKLVQGHASWSNATGAATAPNRQEITGKWVNTSNAVDQIIAYNNAAGDFSTGSELVVLGYDPADTHTNNFWQELASVELGSAGDQLSSGTITAKKYLWVQAYFVNGGGTNRIFPDMRFNSDTSANYAHRRSVDGGADSTFTSNTGIYTVSVATAGAGIFWNGFIINNTSNEKLTMQHTVDLQSGLGAGNAPRRAESVGKWANTSSQITRIDFDNIETGDFGAGSILKVWGAD